MTSPTVSIDGFLKPFRFNLDKLHSLSDAFLRNFERLALESHNQFLPTPISESILRPATDDGRGCHLAIDIGGTNLRVGFVEVRPKRPTTAMNSQLSNGTPDSPSEKWNRIRRLLEKSWPIDEHLKDENPDNLFLWIGNCLAEVIRDGFETLQLSHNQEIPLGVTFSFPMVQHSLSQATLMPMGKGFAISSNLDLGARLLEGYNHAKTQELPPIRVAAISNDSVSTLVSFIFTYDETATRRASMGLILGTGCNATIPLRLSQLHSSKHPKQLPVGTAEDVKIAVNTEWSINGTAPPLKELGFLCQWDEVLDSQNETPGFQPLEYMTAGRYLGELGRIVLVDYMTRILGIASDALPTKLRQRHGLTTTFLSHFRPLESPNLLSRLRLEFPEGTGSAGFVWTEELAAALFYIAKAIEFRAAGIIASATVALLTLSGDIPPEGSSVARQVCNLGVGYTGGCIVHFQDYLEDCQEFLGQLIERRFSSKGALEVILRPCHDGGITGAGILAAAASSVREGMTGQVE